MQSLHNLSICLDLDGTIVDTALDLVRVLNVVIAEEGLPRTDFDAARQDVGFGSKVLITEAFKRADHDISQTRIDELQKLFLKLYADDIAQLSRPFPGVIDTLVSLKQAGADLTVCTNKPGYLARPLIEELGMNALFTRVVGSDDVKFKKPSAMHIYTAVGHRGRKPIVMVGDSLPDVLAARTAKAQSIVMTYGYSRIPATKLGADRVLRNFRNVPSALKDLGF